MSAIFSCVAACLSAASLAALAPKPAREVQAARDDRGPDAARSSCRPPACPSRSAPTRLAAVNPVLVLHPSCRPVNPICACASGLTPIAPELAGVKQAGSSVCGSGGAAD